MKRLLAIVAVASFTACGDLSLDPSASLVDGPQMDVVPPAGRCHLPFSYIHGVDPRNDASSVFARDVWTWVLEFDEGGWTLKLFTTGASIGEYGVRIALHNRRTETSLIFDEIVDHTVPSSQIQVHGSGTDVADWLVGDIISIEGLSLRTIDPRWAGIDEFGRGNAVVSCNPAESGFMIPPISAR